MAEAEGRSVAEFLSVRGRKLHYIESVNRFFQEWDLLLTPSVSVAAFPAERLQPPHWPEHAWDWIGWAEFSWPFNFSGTPVASRSEEHTSELQSLMRISYAVFCLKKKKKQK